eukprot:8916642-Alexandrium_andersonii.AAC.1
MDPVTRPHGSRYEDDVEFQTLNELQRIRGIAVARHPYEQQTPSKSGLRSVLARGMSLKQRAAVAAASA